jgi:integrase
MTVAALCDQYLDEVSSIILPKSGEPKKASTLATDRGRIERHIKPLLGRKKVKAITGPDVERFLRDVAAGRTKADIKTIKHGRAIVRGGRGTATRTVGLLGAIFSYAVKERLRQDNPVRGIKRFRDGANERYLSNAELGRLGEALAAAERDGEHPAVIAAIRLLALTGARRSEILSLRWEYVDLERACLRLPDSKTGAKIIRLGAPAMEVLASLSRVAGNPYVLPGEKDGAHYVGLPRSWDRIRKRAGLEDVRLHDLRHSFASVAAGGGDSLLIIGALLGHKDSATTKRYAHLADDPLRAAAERISGRIAGAMKGEQEAEVVDLAKHRP